MSGSQSITRLFSAVAGLGILLTLIAIRGLDCVTQQNAGASDAVTTMSESLADAVRRLQRVIAELRGDESGRDESDFAPVETAQSEPRPTLAKRRSPRGLTKTVFAKLRGRLHRG